ncbi:Rieske 2Fe-2S domain-containing protein [Niveispirillum fermenti]|uniref:Rieske 2Fe-2S domain-containing protein n=1 Tax=Niveispirillum fermenti TaxID=1233113 RepID=UPI003A8BB1EE
MENFLLNRWYQFGFSHELGDVPLARTIIDIPVVAFRASTGISALLDRCPHRFAPLSTGTIEQDRIVCGYHGLAFDGSGRCALNPHGRATTALRVQSFPVEERHGAIWIWMGDARQADTGLIPDLSFIDETPETARIHFTLAIRASYRLVTDNLLDLSHADYLHPDSLGGVMTGVRPAVAETDAGLAVEWENRDVVPPPRFHERISASQRANAWTRAEWQAPAVMVIKTALTPADRGRSREDEVWALHSMTPETAQSTHYFVCGTRRDRMDDAEYSTRLRAMLQRAFEHEDKPMLEDQQRRIGTADLSSLRPMLLPIDAGAVLARRKLDRLIAQEQAADSAPSQ